MPAPLVAVAPALTNLPSGPRGGVGLPFPPVLSVPLPLPLPSPNKSPTLPNAALPAITVNAVAAMAAAAASAVAAIVDASNPFNNGFIEAINSSTFNLAERSASVKLFLAICAGSSAAAPFLFLLSSTACLPDAAISTCDLSLTDRLVTPATVSPESPVALRKSSENASAVRLFSNIVLAFLSYSSINSPCLY